MKLRFEGSKKSMEEKQKLKFGEKLYQAEVRRLKEMKDVLFDKTFFVSVEENLPLYYMYRDVSKNEEDKRKMKEIGIRYDITTIPPRNLGIEFVKTAGHYHPFISHLKISYAEIYEVLEGKAHYFLQSREIEEDKEKITDVVVLEAKEGDKVIIPPNYGHVTINPSEDTLKMANFVCRSFESLYMPIKRKGGAAYFELKDGKFVKNKSYDNLPKIRFLKPPRIEELREGGMYELLTEPEKLVFLTNPTKFTQLFEKAISP